MISYEEAKKTALDVVRNLDSATEYKDAYMFYNSKAKRAQNSEVVIDKASGKTMTISEWAMKSDDTSTPKRLKF